MSDNPNISIGSHALDFSLPASNGAQIALVDYYTKKSVYLFFVREFN